LLTGAAQVKATPPSPGSATTAVGDEDTFGAPTVIAVIGADANPIPLEFIAATVNVYCAVFVKPVIVWESCVEA
jgi:hypothetical protein